ncbi:hypothetical protein MMC25_008013 [Agyrium rufum]|nr:hypothetical protein [Agyrium rufum]
MPQAVLRKRQRQDYAFHQDYRTRWSDNDMYDHMNNSIYSFLFDSIINAYLIEHCGLHPPTSKQYPIVVSSSCNFFGSVAYPTVLDLGMRVTKLGKTSVTYEVGVFEQGHDDVRAVGGFTHVYVDRDTNRPSLSGMSDSAREGLSKILRIESSKL